MAHHRPGVRRAAGSGPELAARDRGGRVGATLAGAEVVEQGSDRAGPGLGVGPDGVQDVRLALSRLIADPVWYFYLFWFPKYMMDERGMTLLAMAQFAWVVYLAADFGSVGGGLLSGRLIRRGRPPTDSRLRVMALAMLLCPLGALIATGVGIAPTLALAATVAFGHLLFQVNMGALIVDLYPGRVVATVFGMIAAGSGLGGILSTQLVGQIASGGSYATAFLLMGLLHPIAWLVAWASLRSQPRSRLRP